MNLKPGIKYFKYAITLVIVLYGWGTRNILSIYSKGENKCQAHWCDLNSVHSFRSKFERGEKIKM